MALTGHILNENGREMVECYAAGTNGNLPLGVVPCAPNGKERGVYWALPCSNNGLTVTGFEYQIATNGTKPRADAVKVLFVEDVTNGGSYKGVIVPDDYTISSYVAACCEGCDPIADVTVVEPLITMIVMCDVPAPTINVCVYGGQLYVPALTGGATTYTATIVGYNAAGEAITFSPATSTGTTVALLAADMQTNWASELGTGTFVATGQGIEFNSTNGAKILLKVTQA